MSTGEHVWFINNHDKFANCSWRYMCVCVFARAEQVLERRQSTGCTTTKSNCKSKHLDHKTIAEQLHSKKLKAPRSWNCIQNLTKNLILRHFFTCRRFPFDRLQTPSSERGKGLSSVCQIRKYEREKKGELKYNQEGIGWCASLLDLTTFFLLVEQENRKNGYFYLKFRNNQINQFG